MSDKQEKTILDKAVKFSIIASALIFSLAVAYYLAVFIPQKEKNRIDEQKQQAEQQKEESEQQKQEQEANALKEQEQAAIREKEIEDCLSKAKENAKTSWARLCKDNAEEVTRDLKSCESLGIKNDKEFCEGLHGIPDPSPDCLLPSGYADGAKENLKQAKEDCYKN